MVYSVGSVAMIYLNLICGTFSRLVITDNEVRTLLCLSRNKLILNYLVFEIH